MLRDELGRKSGILGQLFRGLEKGVSLGVVSPSVTRGAYASKEEAQAWISIFSEAFIFHKAKPKKAWGQFSFTKTQPKDRNTPGEM